MNPKIAYLQMHCQMALISWFIVLVVVLLVLEINENKILRST